MAISTETPNDIAKKRMHELSEQRNEIIKANIGEIAASLTRVGDTDVERMTERVFVGIWLPYFAGDKDPTYKVDSNIWVNFTGSPYKSANVVSPSGEVLFTIPPLFDRQAITALTGDTSRASISHVVLSANQYARVHPNQGIAYLDKELTKRALVMKVPPNVLANLEAWNAIFKRYGRPPIVDIDALKPEQSQPDGPPSDESDYEFDPL